MSELTPFRRAYLEWYALRPISNRSCCPSVHFTTPGQQPLPDAVVCEREQAWRKYVRIRDNNPDYPFRRAKD